MRRRKLTEVEETALVDSMASTSVDEIRAAKPLSTEWLDREVAVKLAVLRREREVERQLDRVSLRKFAIGLVVSPGMNQFDIVTAAMAADAIIKYINIVD
jgi:hypothetical protein